MVCFNFKSDLTPDEFERIENAIQYMSWARKMGTRGLRDRHSLPHWLDGGARADASETRFVANSMGWAGSVLDRSAFVTFTKMSQ
jgi:hypothetical protein